MSSALPTIHSVDFAVNEIVWVTDPNTQRVYRGRITRDWSKNLFFKGGLGKRYSIKEDGADGPEKRFNAQNLSRCKPVGLLAASSSSSASTEKHLPSDKAKGASEGGFDSSVGLPASIPPNYSPRPVASVSVGRANDTMTRFTNLVNMSVLYSLAIAHPGNLRANMTTKEEGYDVALTEILSGVLKPGTKAIPWGLRTSARTIVSVITISVTSKNKLDGRRLSTKFINNVWNAGIELRDKQVDKEIVFQLPMSQSTLTPSIAMIQMALKEAIDTTLAGFDGDLLPISANNLSNAFNNQITFEQRSERFFKDGRLVGVATIIEPLLQYWWGLYLSGVQASTTIEECESTLLQLLTGILGLSVLRCSGRLQGWESYWRFVVIGCACVSVVLDAYHRRVTNSKSGVHHLLSNMQSVINHMVSGGNQSHSLNVDFLPRINDVSSNKPKQELEICDEMPSSTSKTIFSESVRRWLIRSYKKQDQSFNSSLVGSSDVEKLTEQLQNLDLKKLSTTQSSRQGAIKSLNEFFSGKSQQSLPSISNLLAKSSADESEYLRNRQAVLVCHHLRSMAHEMMDLHPQVGSITVQPVPVSLKSVLSDINEIVNQPASSSSSKTPITVSALQHIYDEEIWKTLNELAETDSVENKVVAVIFAGFAVDVKRDWKKCNFSPHKFLPKSIRHALAEFVCIIPVIDHLADGKNMSQATNMRHMIWNPVKNTDNVLSCLSSTVGFSMVTQNEQLLLTCGHGRIQQSLDCFPNYRADAFHPTTRKQSAELLCDIRTPTADIAILRHLNLEHDQLCQVTTNQLANPQAVTHGFHRLNTIPSYLDLYKLLDVATYGAKDVSEKIKTMELGIPCVLQTSSIQPVNVILSNITSFNTAKWDLRGLTKLTDQLVYRAETLNDLRQMGSGSSGSALYTGNASWPLGMHRIGPNNHDVLDRQSFGIAAPLYANYSAVAEYAEDKQDEDLSFYLFNASLCRCNMNFKRPLNMKCAGQKATAQANQTFSLVQSI